MFGFALQPTWNIDGGPENVCICVYIFVGYVWPILWICIGWKLDDGSHFHNLVDVGERFSMPCLVSSLIHSIHAISFFLFISMSLRCYSLSLSLFSTNCVCVRNNLLVPKQFVASFRRTWCAYWKWKSSYPSHVNPPWGKRPRSTQRGRKTAKKSAREWERSQRASGKVRAEQNRWKEWESGRFRRSRLEKEKSTRSDD